MANYPLIVPVTPSYLEHRVSQGLHCLPFHLHLFAPLLCYKTNLFHFRTIYYNHYFSITKFLELKR